MSDRSPGVRVGLGKYELIDEIGHGGMATVYRARDLRLGREVAVKLIHPHLRQNPEVAVRFINEAKAVAKLKHPGIVEVFDISDEADPDRFLVAELVRGPSLRQLLSEHGAMPPEIGACFGVLLGEALGHAHDAGIVHRDVKPENVLVQLDAQTRIAHVKLTDFGIAKILDTQGVTSTGQVLGSPAHMAPEQIEGGQVDGRADVFCLGVLVYECMTGTLPFEGQNPAQVLRKVLDGTFAPADQVRPAVGCRWARIVSRAISRHPKDRQATVQEFANDLRTELRAIGVREPRQEIFNYLDKPGEYQTELSGRLSGVLSTRADQCRKKGDIQGASDDLNRLAAYLPDDGALLRKISALARGQRRRSWVRRAAGIALGAAALGVVAMLASWGMRSGGSLASVVSSSSKQPAPAPSQSDSNEIPGRQGPTPSESSSRSSIRVPIARRLDETREVLIMSRPQSAFVSIDQGAAQPVQFGVKTRLSVGKHTLSFSVDPSNRCCEPVSTMVAVVPDDGTGAQRLSVSLPFRAASLSLTGGPPDGRLRCQEIKADIGMGAEQPVKMADPDLTVRCTLDGTGVSSDSRLVTLRPGATTVVKWPSSE